MNDLNYHHLRYFWTVAREGGVSRAARRLGVSQPAVSAQIRSLERALGERLFKRRGRILVLTDFGDLVQGYAEKIFTLGGELGDVARGRPAGRPLRLVVGINHGMPKLVVTRLLEPALRLPQPVRIVVRDDRSDRLLAGLEADEFDLVLSDAPASPTRVRVFNHLLGSCGVTIFGTPELLEQHPARFPQMLDGASFLLPTEGTTLRSSLEQWFGDHGIQPRIVAEIADTTVLRGFGSLGAGFFATPSPVHEEVTRIHGVRAVGKMDGVKENFYAISVERRVKHPAVLAITQGARRDFFA